MSETERQRRLLEEALAEAHRSTRRRTPPFAAVWSRAVAEMRPRRIAQRRRLAVAAVVALVLAVTAAFWTVDRRSQRRFERALTVAEEAGRWRSPLDFLLETPGREWLEATPSLAPNPALERWRLPPEPLDQDS